MKCPMDGSEMEFYQRFHCNECDSFFKKDMSVYSFEIDEYILYGDKDENMTDIDWSYHHKDWHNKLDNIVFKTQFIALKIDKQDIMKTFNKLMKLSNFQ